MKAADSFANPITAINQLWQADFTNLEVTRAGLPIHRARRLVPLYRRLEALHHHERCRRSPGRSNWPYKPRGSIKLRSIRGQGCSRTMAPSYVANDLSKWLEGQGMRHTLGEP